jgi:uncharacterized protein YbjT (DUF2867 family)
MERAFEGATAVFTMIPIDPLAQSLRAHQNRVAEVYARAIERSGIKRAVNLSSVGAHLSRGVGPIGGLHDGEERLNQISQLHVVHLRPGWFMENVLAGLEMMHHQGRCVSPLRPDLALAMVAIRDVARAAARLLTGLEFLGVSTRELLGERDLSMAQATAVIGRTVGRPELQYVQLSYDEAEQGLIRTGLSPDVARAFVEMQRALNEGVLRPAEKRSADNTTPSSFDEFAAQVVAPRWRSFSH